MDRIGFVEHEGIRIFVIDFSGLMPEELAEVIDRARDVISRQQEKSLLTLTKVGGARFNTEVVKALKEFARENDPYVKRGAVVGLEGLQRLVLDTVSRFSKRDFIVCRDMEEAKARLVSE